MKMTAKEYWKLFLFKCLDNLASVKVWMFLLPFMVASGLMAYIISMNVDFINLSLQLVKDEHPQEAQNIINSFAICVNAFTAWCTFNVALITPIIAVREIFKVKKLNALANGTAVETKEIIKKMAA
jgi:hypothetical protein